MTLLNLLFLYILPLTKSQSKHLKAEHFKAFTVNKITLYRFIKLTHSPHILHRKHHTVTSYTHSTITFTRATISISYSKMMGANKPPAPGLHQVLSAHTNKQEVFKLTCHSNISANPQDTLTTSLSE